MFLEGCMRMRIESGTCNVCSAPCSSCMHYNRSMSAIGSKSESEFSGIICVRGEEADSSSVINLDGMPICKSRNHDDLQHVASETSNLLSTSSSHNSYFENANSKAIFRNSTAYDASDDVDMTQVVSCEFVEEEQPFKRNHVHDQVSSHIDISAHLGHRFSSGQGEEQSGLECHGDNILDTYEVRDANAAVCDHIVDVEEKCKECSNMMISTSFEVNNKAIPTEAEDGNQYLETGESHSILRKLKATGDASLMDNICNSASVNTVSSVKSQLLLPECDISPENDSQSSHSQKVSLSFHKGESKDIEEILNSQPLAEIIRCAEVDNVESSFASLTSGSSTEHNCNTFPNHEASAASLIRSGFFSGNSKIDELCKETRTTTDLEKPFDNDSKGNHVNVPLEGNGDVLDATKGQGYHVGRQATTEGEISDSDIVLDDVKVCDICGDAGREDLLAICSRCSDGAEHTYCMSEMLHKVPEEDWLCEECKIKEMKNQNVDEYEAVSGRLNPTCLNESSKNACTLISKKLPKLDTGPTDLDTRGPSKGLQSPHILTRRQADHPEEGKASELNGDFIETASPRKKPALSHQISLRNQGTGKVKTASMPTLSEVQSKGSEIFPQSKTYLRSSSFKGQPPHHSPRGLLSRSVSFSYSKNMPKVETLIQNVPHKQNISRESTTDDLRKEMLVKSLTKSTSFKNTTSGRPNAELTSKSSSFQPSLIEGLRGQKEVKGRSTIERNNFSAMQNSFFRSSAAVSSNYPIKVDVKSVHSDGKIRTISETDVRSLSKGFNDADDLGSNEAKKHASCSSKSIGSFDGNSSADHLKKFKALHKGMQTSISAIDGSNSKVEIESKHSAESLESGRKGESMRDSPISTSSRLSALGGSQKLRCQRCNETGHATQHCSIDKFQKSAHKPVDEGNSSEVVKKGNKWREIVDASISRSRIVKGKKPDTCEELLATNTDTNCETASKYTPSAFIQRNIVSVVDSRNGKDTSKDLKLDSTKKLVPINSGQPAVLPLEVSDVPRAGSHCPTSTKLSVKPFAETLRGHAPLLANTLRASAIPNLERIWQGSFNVLGTGNFPEIFDGIQAHLSTCASHRVFEAAIKVPGSLQLEEVSYNISWPSHFHGIGPQEENIGLFFFAKDVKSYEKNYRKLMDRMHKNDLSLRGNIDGIELLIFTSKKLPMNSQRWNMMYYLWGMFRAKRRYCLPVMGDQKKPSLSNLDMELPNQDLSTPSTTHVPNAQNFETSSKLIQLSESRSSKMMPGESTNSVDLWLTASGVGDKTCRTLEASLVQKSLNQVVNDPNVPQGQPSCSVGNSFGTTAEPLTVTDSLKSMLLMSTSKSCSKEKTDGTFEKKFVNNCTNRKTEDWPALACDLGEESSVRRASSVPLGSNCNQGDEFSSFEGKMREKECSTFGVATIDDDPRRNVLEADFLNNESRANRKRGRSCSIERVSELACWMSTEDERELKKNCYPSDSSVTDCDVSIRLSSKVHPLYSSILSQQEQRECIYSEPVMLENSITTERCFFPIDLCPAQNNKSANSTHNEDTPESCTPDLELALGGKSKSTKPAALPLLFASVAGGQQHMQSGSLGDDGDDVSASLSLSLGFPAPERVRSAKSILKKEHVLPERPSANNTSLFLFGRFCNT